MVFYFYIKTSWYIKNKKVYVKHCFMRIQVVHSKLYLMIFIDQKGQFYIVPNLSTYFEITLVPDFKL